MGYKDRYSKEPTDADRFRWALQEQIDAMMPALIASMYRSLTTFGDPEPVRKRPKKNKLQRMIQRAAKRKNK